jgi:hypothetical protein
MGGRSDPGLGQGPVYIYNGLSNLGELKEVNLNGANLFFNGSFCIEDLREVDLLGATVFLNGQPQVRTSTPKTGHPLTVDSRQAKCSLPPWK